MIHSIEEIKDIRDPKIQVYSSLTERNLSGSGLFIAESPKVINVALDEGYEAVSLLCERKHIEGDASGILERCPDLRVFTGERDILASLTGYKLTRGVLCAMRRKASPKIEEICKNSRMIAVLESVCDTTNIGSIFRSASALGVDGILLTPDSCDPFNRRSIRVSMGTVFKVPWAMVNDPVSLLHDYGFTTIAMTLHRDSLKIDNVAFQGLTKIAVVLGTEGDGLSDGIISKCDYKAIIPMHHGIDSLNVGAAAAVAFWQFSRHL